MIILLRVQFGIKGNSPGDTSGDDDGTQSECTNGHHKEYHE